MKMTCWSGGLAVWLAVLSFETQAVTIDFETLASTDVDGNHTTENYHGDTYTEKGFTLQGATQALFPLYSYGQLHPLYRGSTALHFGLQGVDASLTANSGGTFTLTSIDIAEVNAGMASVMFTGYLQGGGSISQTFMLDGVLDDGTGNGFETFQFNTSFTNLTSVVWSNENFFHQFDNIVVSTVPVPAAAWLFGSGLLGLLGVARQRRYT